MLTHPVVTWDRKHRFAILAMLLSSLFDITQSTDCLCSALNMLTEYEQAKEENGSPKMVPQLSFLSSLGLCRRHPGNGYQIDILTWVTIPWECLTLTPTLPFRTWCFFFAGLHD